MSFIPAFEIGILNGWIFTIFFVFHQIIMRPIMHRHNRKMDSNIEKAAYYINVPTMFVLSLYSVFLPLKLGTACFYVGLFIYLMGTMVMITALVNFYSAPAKEPVTNGIYHYSRHPMYLAFILWFVGVGIATASWIIILVSIILVVPINIGINSEERYCLKKYGDIYQEYLNTVPRWIGISK